MFAPVLPREDRDPEDQQLGFYHVALRRESHKLAEENWQLKKLLGKHKIPWSTISRERMEAGVDKHQTVSNGLRLPTEVLLRIVELAMTSPHPIVDPLSPRTLENLSCLELARKNQIAIHFLATCRAMYEEGTRYLWQRNHFVFTSPHALRRFGELSACFRHPITSITLRVIARYYDDQYFPYTLEADYHPELQEDQLLRVCRRVRPSPLVQGGFRCYTWSQIVDFLQALRAPYSPVHLDSSMPRQLLLPNLTALRVDLVNFATELVPFPGYELHHITSHEFGCTLDELQVTGLPYDIAGDRASVELSGLLKDEGLYLVAEAAYLARQDDLQPLSGTGWEPTVVRAWTPASGPAIDEDHRDYDAGNPFCGLHRPKIGKLPEAAAETNWPRSTHRQGTTIWKRTPIRRDSSQRTWKEFERATGYPLQTMCLDCENGVHGGTCFRCGRTCVSD